jgi:hypothetical protein
MVPLILAPIAWGILVNSEPQFWSGQSFVRRVSIVIAFLISLFALAAIIRFGVDTPVYETWLVIPAWERYATGGDWLKDLFYNFWGHSIPIPVAIMLAVGDATNHHLKLQMYLTWAIAAGAFFWIFIRFVPSPAIILAAVAIAFTVRGAEVWLNSFNLLWPLSMGLAVGAGLCLVGALNRRLFVLGAILSLTAVLTMSQGIVVPVAGAVVLAVRSIRASEARPYLMAWCVVVVIGLAIFVWLRPSGAASASGLFAALTLEKPLQFLRLLSQSLLDPARASVGFVLLSLFLGAFIVCFLKRLENEPYVLFWTFTFAYVAGTCFLIAIGRGVPQARYLLVSWPVVPAVLSLWWFAASSRRFRGIVDGIAVCTAVVFLYGSVNFWRTLDGWSGSIQAASKLIQADPQSVPPLDWPGALRDGSGATETGIEIMRRMKVNAFDR